MQRFQLQSFIWQYHREKGHGRRILGRVGLFWSSASSGMRKLQDFFNQLDSNSEVLTIEQQIELARILLPINEKERNTLTGKIFSKILKILLPANKHLTFSRSKIEAGQPDFALIDYFKTDLAEQNKTSAEIENILRGYWKKIPFILNLADSSLQAKINQTRDKINRIQSMLINKIQQDYVDTVTLITTQKIINSASKDINDLTVQDCVGKLTYFGSADLQALFWYPGPYYRKNFNFNEFAQCFEKNPDALKILPSVAFRKFKGEKVDFTDPTLITQIANVQGALAVWLILMGVDINSYSPFYGNTPLLLALAKGWNHTENERSVDPIVDMKIIIDELLKQRMLDINAILLCNGMNALHLVCLRGDDPVLVERLLKLKIDMYAVDTLGIKPYELLDLDYETTQEIISTVTGNFAFGAKMKNHGQYHEFPSNKSYTATLPTEAERQANIKQIRELFKKYKYEPRVEAKPSASIYRVSL